jgi:hydrogenase maturation protease
VTATTCRTLVGGLGLPGLRDLDAGRQFVRYAEQFDWPEGVVVEDLSCAAHLVLHRLQELDPARVVLVGAAARGEGRPGTVRRYRLGTAAPDPLRVHAGLAGSMGGFVDLDHTIGVVRHWGALPADTVVIEVEPADTSLGPGFSDEVAVAFDRILDLVREEAASAVPVHAAAPARQGAPVAPVAPVSPVAAVSPGSPARPRRGPATLLEVAERVRADREVANAVRRVRASLPVTPRVPGLSVACRLRAFAGGLAARGTWFDFMPLGGAWLGVAIGEVDERGLEAAVAVSHLRAATRAHASAAGRSPVRVVEAVDRLVADTALGRMASLLYLAADGSTGEVRLASAGHCPPLLRDPDGQVEAIVAGRAERLGADRRGRGVPEVILKLRPGSSLLLYSAGMPARPRTGAESGFERLCRAVAGGPADAEALCDHVLDHCLTGARRTGDAALVTLSRPPT